VYGLEISGAVVPAVMSVLLISHQTKSSDFAWRQA